MGCLRTSKRIIKSVAQRVKPMLVKSAVDVVRAIEVMSADDPVGFWTSDTKRAAALAVIKSEATRLGNVVPNRTYGLLLEYALEAVMGDEDEDELGQDDPNFEAELEAA